MGATGKHSPEDTHVIRFSSSPFYRKHGILPVVEICRRTARSGVQQGAAILIHKRGFKVESSEPIGVKAYMQAIQKVYRLYLINICRFI